MQRIKNHIVCVLAVSSRGTRPTVSLFLLIFSIFFHRSCFLNVCDTVSKDPITQY